MPTRRNHTHQMMDCPRGVAIYCDSSVETMQASRWCKLFPMHVSEHVRILGEEFSCVLLGNHVILAGAHVSYECHVCQLGWHNAFPDAHVLVTKQLTDLLRRTWPWIFREQRSQARRTVGLVLFCGYLFAVLKGHQKEDCNLLGPP